VSLSERDQNFGMGNRKPGTGDGERCSSSHRLEGWIKDDRSFSNASRLLLTQKAWLGLMQRLEETCAPSAIRSQLAVRLSAELKGCSEGKARWLLLLQRWQDDMNVAGITALLRGCPSDSRALLCSLGIGRLEPVSAGPLLAQPRYPLSLVFDVCSSRVGDAVSLAHTVFERAGIARVDPEEEDRISYATGGAGVGLNFWGDPWPGVRQHLVGLLPRSIVRTDAKTLRGIFEFLGHADLTGIPFRDAVRAQDDLRLYRPTTLDELVAYLGIVQFREPSPTQTSFLCRGGPVPEPPEFISPALRPTGGHLADTDQLRAILAGIQDCSSARAEWLRRDLRKGRTGPRSALKQLGATLRRRGLFESDIAELEAWLISASKCTAARSLLTGFALDVMEAAYLKLHHPHAFQKALEAQAQSSAPKD
jgi:hypothetical protein